MNKLYKYCFCICLAFYYIPVSDAQDTIGVAEEYVPDSTAVSEQFDVRKRLLSASAWQKLVEDSAFNYKNEKEAVVSLNEENKQEHNAIIQGMIKLMKLLTSTTGQLLFWLFVFTILSYVAYRIFKGDISNVFGRKEKKKAAGNMTVITPEDLTNADWEVKLGDALLQGDKRAATRFAFVRILQLLHQKQYINYRIDTTNFEYYASLHNEELKPLFRDLLLRYEYAWFGQFKVGDSSWEETMNLYQRIKNKL